MAAEAQYLQDEEVIQFTAAAALASGEVIQLEDGRAAVVSGAKGFASGERASARVRGRHKCIVGSSVTFADGDPVYWDASANTCINAGSCEDGDFYLGSAVGAKGSGVTSMNVDVNGPAGAQRGLFSSRVKLIDHADASEHILIDAKDNPNGLALVALLGEVTEQPAGSSEDQLIVTLFDEDDNAIDTLTTSGTPDDVGDIVVGATAMYATATGGVFKKIPAGKAAYVKVTQATAGTPAGAMKVRAVVMPLV